MPYGMYISAEGAAAQAQRSRDRARRLLELKAGSIQLIIYTATGALSFSDEKVIRRSAILFRVPCITTLSGARAAAEAIAARKGEKVRVWSLQQIHEAKKTTA